MQRTCRVGLHGRNDTQLHEPDYRVILESGIETVKMMSHTQVEHFRRLKNLRPDLEIITRLYDDRISRRGHPTPEQFAQRMIPAMRQLQATCTKFEIHNEPNHMDGVEGWGDTDADARNFNAWFVRTAAILKQYCPWASLGFPGLAIPHRDLDWIELCRPAVDQADWLGVHCYWQTPPQELHNHLSDFWGLRFKYYHQKFPQKIIELTEVGNANVQSGIPFSEDLHAREYREYLTECFKYPYLNSASFFIISSPDPRWDGFTWRSEDGRPHKVVWAIRDMSRPHLAPAQPAAPARKQPAPDSVPAPSPAVDAGQVQHLQAQTAQLQVQMRRLQAQNAQLLARRQTAQTRPTAAPAVQRGQPARPVSAAAKTRIRGAVPVVQNLTRQLTRNPAARLTARPLAQIDRIIIHHSGVAPTVGAAQIANFMVNQRKQAGIPYHYFVTANGTLQQTNDLTIIAAHSSPALNLVAVGIGFAGNFNRVPPPPAQIDAGARLIAWLVQKLNLSPRAVFGHKELVQTQSPGLQWDSGANWGAQLRQKIQAYLTGAA